MKNKILSLLGFFFIGSLIVNCTSEDVLLQGETPMALTIAAVVEGQDLVNPNGDGSGKVVFNTNATNALTYTYKVNNAEVGTVIGNSFNYTFVSPGINTYDIEVIAKSRDGLTASKSLQLTVFVFDPTVLPGLIWADEFDTNGAPDASKWTMEIGNNNGWGNQELQYYTDRPDNVIVEDGILKITAKRESFEGFDFTSTRMITKDKFEFTYGRVEGRIKLPAGAGVWPAFWMLGFNIDTIGWPSCGEIDIMEYVGNRPNEAFATVHWNDNGPTNSGNDGVDIANLTSEYKIYAVEWNMQELKFFVDDQQVFTFTNQDTLPFNHDFFMILNVAMGGTFGGNVDAAFTEASMEVDYVRVYELQ